MTNALNCYICDSGLSNQNDCADPFIEKEKYIKQCLSGLCGV